LANFLNEMGADIQGMGTSIITIKGVKKLHGISYKIISDRIEAGTFMCAAVITKGDVLIQNFNTEHLASVISCLKKAGVKIQDNKNSIRVSCNSRIKPVDIITTPYPGFPIDMQAQWMALMCIAQGSSTISETVFENRFMHVHELVRMGAHLHINGHIVTVRGKDVFSGAQVMATDLRASAALVLAGLAAKEETIVSRIYHLDRGYEHIEDKLKKLGADIKRVKS